MRIEKERIITLRELWEKERNRCIKLVEEKKRWGNKVHWYWMFEMFGETLTEKTTFMNNNGTLFDEADCQVCGYHPKPDEKMMHFDFSFCSEYECGLTICKNCLKRLAKELK